MTKRIITNQKFIVERDGDNWVLKFKDGKIYKPIEFNNAQLSGRKNRVITQPNFSIIDDELFVNVNGHDVKIGEVGDGYGRNISNVIDEPNLDVVISNVGKVVIVTEINGKQVAVNSNTGPVYPPNSIIYTALTKPTSTWIDSNCSENVFDENTGNGYMVLNDGVTTLSNGNSSNIFGNTNDTNVTSIVLPESIVTIGNNAFKGCSGLTGTLTIPSSVTSIGQYAFYNCSGLTGTLTIPSNVTSIGEYAFYGCSGLTSLIIQNGVTSIGTQAFRECSGFTGSLTIPSSVTTISSGAFQNCSGFTGSLTIPSSVTIINETTFYGCVNFVGSLTIPSSVTSIGNSAFFNARRFAQNNCYATTPPTLSTNSFSTNIVVKTISVPAESITAYQNSDWSSYFTTFLPIQE